MRVLFINSDYESGSTGRIVRDLKKELENQNNECLALYGRENPSSDDGVYRIGDKLSVYFHVISTRLGDNQGFSSTFATKRCLNAIEKFQPDIIHLHNLHGSYINCEVLFKYIKRRNIPTVWTLHDCWSFTGHCSNYSFAECNKWTQLCEDCPQSKEYPKSFVDLSRRNYQKKKETFSGCKYLKITTVSQWLKGEVQKSFLNQYPVTVVPNGVDLSVFLPKDVGDLKKKLKFEGKRVLISVASVWGPRKGLDLILKIATQLGNEYRWLIVGLNQEIGGLPDNIIVIRRTDSIHELSDLYNVADIFVNTSVEETFGMVSLEALACGKPVITNRLTANPELVDETCGIVVDCYDINSYLAAIKDKHIWQQKVEDCRKRAEKYSHHAMIENYLSVYRSML